VEKAGGNVASRDLDTRLLRFRNQPNSEPAEGLGSELVEGGRAAEALEVLRTALASAPDDAALLLLEGRAWLQEGDLIRAQAALLKAARAAPKDERGFRWLGEVLLKRGDPDRAAKVLERALALAPHDRDIVRLKGRAERLARIATDIGEDSIEGPTVVEARALDQHDGYDHGFDESTTLVEDGLDEDDEEDHATAIVQLDAQGNIVNQAPAKTDVDATSLPFAGDPPTEPVKGLGRPKRVPKRTQVGIGPAMVPLEDEPFGPDPFADAPTNTVRGTKKRAAPPPTDFAPPVASPYPAAAFAPPPPAPPVAPPAPAFVPPMASPRPAPPAPYQPPPASFEPPVAPPPPAPHGSTPASSSFGFDSLPSESPGGADFDDPIRGTPDHRSAGLHKSDLEAGSTYGQPEDVDQILRMLSKQGIFEAPTGEAGQWASRKEVRAGRSGTRIGVLLGIAWLLTVGLAVGGYFGWQKWVEIRHAEASALVAQAYEAALAGDHVDLVDAERHLVLARELNPHDADGPAVLLLVHAQRALEDGTFEPGYLRPSIRRAESHEAPEAMIRAATAVLAAGEGDMDSARENVEAALAADAEDPAVLYMVGRIEQRLGMPAALEHLEGAITGEGALVAASMAVAEARADDGNDNEAIELIDTVLASDPTHLRASLWKAFITADDQDPAEALASLDEKTANLDELGAATDRVIAGLTRARLLRRMEESEAATEAVDEAAQGGATDPRLLALVAREAQSVGLMGRAQAAATNALRGAPTNPELRKLLAEIFLTRRDGFRALQTLGTLSANDPEVLLMSARGALLVGGEETLAAAAEALAADYEARPEEANVELRALQIRVAVEQGHAAEALPAARALAEEAPGDANAALALGEAALRARQPELAVESLERLIRASPDDAEGHYLLGRALRMSNEPEEAEASLRRALELLPSHTDAQITIGRLLLDLGRYEDADGIYQTLAQQGGMVSGMSTAVRGRLGRVEALVGLGRLADATVQLENLRADDRELAVAQIARAILSLAKGQPGDAVAAMRPLAEREAARASDIALFGDALFDAGETEAAAERYEQAVTLDPGLPEAILGKARLAIRAEQSRDAFLVLDRVEESLGRRVRSPAFRAQVLTLRGRAYLLDGLASRSEAREALSAAVALPGAPAAAFFFLGEALAGENAPEARNNYLHYLEMEEDGPFARRARRALR